MFHYLYISTDEQFGKHLRIMSSLPNASQSDAFSEPISITAGLPVYLAVNVNRAELQFGYRIANQDWTWIVPMCDASILSDEASPPGRSGFTGAFVGMACQDMSGSGLHADFDFFEYLEASPDFSP